MIPQKMFSALIVSITALNLYILLSQLSRLREGVSLTLSEPIARLPGSYQEATILLNHSELSLSNDTEWKRLVAGGYVRLGDTHKPYGVSFYHHLHCWERIRSNYLFHKNVSQQAQPDEETLLDSQQRAEPRLEKAKTAIERHIHHDDHCFQYMALALLCRADTTLLPFSDSISVADAGESRGYRCRDWAQVREAIQSNWRKWKGEPYKGVEIVPDPRLLRR
ncbi:hypothetical protein NMY22_g14171 [Coprinellus aureogranulatus]|nr:hypothetical protein NMY22_g14171 [Coprinellus aureogranulatus]